MKKHLTEDIELREIVLKGLKENDGYCPCVYNSKGNPKYKCPCPDFKDNTEIGQSCYCGLYIKDN